jgi:polysaccharide pyruvyl transferase WcaK-like protein
MSGQGVRAYAEVFIRWLKADLNRAILLLPHDLRPAPVGDVEALEAIANAIWPHIPDRLELVRPPIAAWDVKALCADADGVFTGRMHLAIAALGTGAPPLSIVYVDKFEGLMSHFELEGGLITPSEFLDGERTYSVLETFTKELPERRSKILGRLPAVQQLARRQFELFREFAK